MMTRLTIMLTVLTVFALAGSADAACFADYKAKRDNPLRLHYGIIELPDVACGDQALAKKQTNKRLAAGNWQLLNILSTFGPDGLENRKENAGQFYLRF